MTTASHAPWPLRIALTGYRSHPHVGGQGIYLRHLAQALHARGHQVTVISGPPYPDLPAEIPLVQLPSLNLYDSGADTGFKWRYLSDFTNLVEWLSRATGGFAEPWCFARRLNAYLRQSPAFDVVHDNQCLGTGLLSLPYPLLETIHHPITRDRDQAIASATTPLARYGAWRWYRFVSMQARVARRLEAVVTVSDASRHDIADCFKRKTETITVIPNGIDNTRFCPAPDTKVPWRVMSTASSALAVKGFSVLAEALAQLVAQLPAVEIVLVGDFPATGPNRRLLRALGLESRIQFCSQLEEAALIRLYQSASVYVCPSFYEGFGLPVLEAMSCGTAVVTTNGGALAEVAGDSAWVVPTGDSGALANAMQQLLTDDKARQHFETRGRERALAAFSWQTIAAAYETVYRQLLDKSRSS